VTHRPRRAPNSEGRKEDGRNSHASNMARAVFLGLPMQQSFQSGRSGLLSDLRCEVVQAPRGVQVPRGHKQPLYS
jgi:hypothetical protein